MHILLLNDDSLPKSQGGAAVVVKNLSKAYRQEGHTVTLVTTHQDAQKGPIVREEGVVSLLSIYPPNRRHRHCLGNVAMTKALSEVFAELKPDAVHAHNVHAHLTYESLLIAKQHTSNIILTAHDVFLVAFFRVRGKRLLRLMRSGKSIRLHFWEHIASVGRKYWPLRNRTIKKILAQSGAKVVAISEAHRHFLEANGITVSAVIYNGTNVTSPVSTEDSVAFREHAGLTGPTILFGGRLSSDKGSDVLLEAFARVRNTLPTAQLLIVGEAGRIKESLQAVSPEHRSAIVTPGWLSTQQMCTAYSASTLVTTPNVCFEPFNLMNIEAMAAGKPVVASLFGGAPEIIEEGQTGLVIDPTDIDAFAQALLLLLQDPQKAQQMGTRGRERAQQLFSIETQCTEYLGLLSIE